MVYTDEQIYRSDFKMRRKKKLNPAPNTYNRGVKGFKTYYVTKNKQIMTREPSVNFSHMTLRENLNDYTLHLSNHLLLVLPMKEDWRSQ